MSSFFDDIEDDILNDDISTKMEDLYNTDLSTYSKYKSTPVVPFTDIINKDIKIFNRNIALYSAYNKNLTYNKHYQYTDKLKQLINDNNSTLMIMSNNKRDKFIYMLGLSTDKIYYQTHVETFPLGRTKSIVSGFMSDIDLTDIDVVIDLDR